MQKVTEMTVVASPTVFSGLIGVLWLCLLTTQQLTIIFIITSELDTRM